ncbi:DUF721 domain-containing protein [Flavobacterium sp. xlx-214]|uniref:DUF721 domain-containing protein n=1 Tax=unclassified Flavobacterium TaxID=196869 RepID=UPI0013D75A34|nr:MULTISPECIES: DUF721 domain-containing protein [unclassified Flavobacterium]MBA5791250.1 DUF721 domain-containing protein [Flavobacterium sp. xlx-221]QMI83584.1 DUF721 domain-containing protein [Flavobacterium sp. xlx-214]
MNNKKFNPYKRSHEQSSVQDVLGKMIQGYNLDKGIDKVNVREAWIRLLGPGIATYTLQVELRKSTLFVALTSDVLREELSYGLDKIIKMINEDLGKEIVTKIILR